MIPYGKQDINEADIAAVVDVLRSDFLTQGPVVPAFEEAVSRYCGAPHAVAVNSATSALHIACLALGVGPGDIVWTSSITFVASANCALYCGASVDFVDIDRYSYTISVSSLAEKLARAKKSNTLPKVVIPVHLCGQSCDMASIHVLADRYGFKIIEDASHAIGGRYRDRAIGSCLYSDICVFSFHPVKIITTGEGGIALTKDAALAKQMKQLRCHGISTDPDDLEPRPSSELWNYQQLALGYNYRMMDINAALGLSQLDRLDSFVATRHRIAANYDQALADLPLRRPVQGAESYSSFHLYPIRIEKEGGQIPLYHFLREQGIGVNLHYIPVYLQPYYEKMGFRRGYCPEAESYFATAITLPLHPGLSSTEQDQVVAALEKGLS